jgi:hypothetical protein
MVIVLMLSGVYLKDVTSVRRLKKIVLHKVQNVG